MTRPASLLLLIAGLGLPCGPASAQTASSPIPHHAHARKAKAAKTAAPQPAPASGGINQPSADFSTVEPPVGQTDGDDRQPGGNVRPVMGAGGNIGFGTGF